MEEVPIELSIHANELVYFLKKVDFLLEQGYVPTFIIDLKDPGFMCR